MIDPQDRTKKTHHGVVIIGICGGISSGKSTVAEEFGRLGALVLDADVMVHEILKDPGIQERIISRWGKEILSHGEINRPALSKKVFGNQDELDALTAILHPPVVRRAEEAIQKVKKNHSHSAVVLDAPLLIETGMDRICHVMIFVKADLEVRKMRVSSSREWSGDEISRREKFQKKVNDKEERADYIVDNNFSKVDTRRQVEQIWGKLQGNS